MLQLVRREAQRYLIGRLGGHWFVSIEGRLFQAGPRSTQGQAVAHVGGR